MCLAAHRKIMRTALITVLCLSSAWETAGEPILLRVENLLVAPSHGPLARVAVKNTSAASWTGTVGLVGPAGWRIVPDRREVTVAPGQIRRVAFNVERGAQSEANRYAVEAFAQGAGFTVRRKQEIRCTSAPYFKPTIDGLIDEWKDAIPVSFIQGGKRTTIGTYWNRSQFSLLVEVEEDRLVGYREDGPFDAVQIALAPAPGADEPPENSAGRFEFLIAGTGQGGEGQCFQLAEPTTALADVVEPRALSGLECKAQVVVSRQGNLTRYECGLPMKPMRQQIPPSEGREFCLSVLVHDPDGTGVRDWGEAAGLWPCQRMRPAWSVWQGAVWNKQPPMDSRVEWGLCASKY